MVELKDIFGFIAALAWPLVVAIALITFRRPLSEFLKEVARRATKFSITQHFSFELPEVSRPTLDQYLQFQSFAEGLIGAEGADSRSILLSLWGDKAIDYMIVDLGSGEKWLTSRLFIFAVMLERMQALRCLVFLETHTRTHVPRSFLGTALPHEVRWSLAQQYPWLEEAYVRAQVGVFDKYKSYEWPWPTILSKQGKLSPMDASELVDIFLQHVQGKGEDKNQPPDPTKTSEWIFIEKKQEKEQKGEQKYWEHANWIDGSRLERDLGSILHKSDDAWFEDSLDISRVKRVQALLRRKGFFVTLTNKERQFQSLVDREALLEQVAERLGKVSEDQTPIE